MSIILLCALVVLAGCGNGSALDSEDEGHRFASEPRPTAEPTATIPATPTELIAHDAPEPTIPPEDALDVRGAPQYVYLVINEEMQVYDSAARTFTPLDLEVDFFVLDYSSSPTGDRVGILGMLEEQFVVQFYGADGEQLGEAISLPINFSLPQSSPVASPMASPIASPVSAEVPVRMLVNWVPQGNAVVVSGPGSMMRVTMDGEVMPISRTGVTGTVVEALWSPMDSQVAILTQMRDGHEGVFVLESGHAEADELEELHMQPDQSLSNLQWLPNGLGLVLVVGNTSDGDLLNGQLYVYRFGEVAPVLVATSGQGGPAGTISHAVVSPDGNSVAYAVMVRDGGEWYLHSLWVRSLRGGPSLSIPTTSTAPISDIVWSSEGLVWQQADGNVQVIDSSLEPRSLGEEPLATPVASPEATPVIAATPRG